MGMLQYYNILQDLNIHIPSTGHPSATFGYRNFAAMYLICAIPLSVLYFLWATSRLSTIIAILSTISMTTFLIYTRTRGAWGGLGGGVVVVMAILFLNANFRKAWLAAVGSKFNKEKTILFSIGILLLLSLAQLSPRFTDTGLQRFDEKKANITTTVASVFQSGGDRGRSEMWRNTLNLIQDHPLIGIGPGSWKRTYPPYDRGVMIRQNTSPVRPHNDYLWTASEYGLLGLLCYLGFFTAIFYAIYQTQHSTDPLQIASGPLIAVALLAFMGHAFFSFPKEQPQAAIFVYLLAGLIITPHRHNLSRLASRAILLVIIVQSLSATALYYAYMRFDRHYLYALVAEDHNDWPGVEREIRSALNWGSFRSHAWVIAGRATERRENFVEAESAYRQAISLSPHSWHAHNGLGIVLKRQKRYAEAERHYLEALRYFPGEGNAHSANIRTNLGALYKSM